ncbi:MAG: glycoside hydrolase family 44 protein, partial [Roseiflexaceae bacterium]
MTTNRYKLTILALVLALLAAILIPLVRRNELPRLALAADSQMVIGCTTKLTVEMQDQRATLRCAAPGDLTTGAAQSAEPPFVPIAPAAGAPTAPAASAAPEPSSAAKPIFEEQLDSSWSNWSWGSTIDTAAKTAHTGSAAIGVTYTDGWSGLYLHANQPLASSGFHVLRFWANGGNAGGQQIRVCFVSSCDKASATYTLEANTWKSYDIALVEVGAASLVNDLIWQNATADAQKLFFLDDIALIATGQAQSSGTPAADPAGSGPALAVDTSADRHAISPLIYGMNFPDPALLNDLGLTVQRWGGNATTRYNWRNDTSNRASDWFFENVPNENANVAALPNGSSSDTFVDQGQKAGVKTILTIPLIGWTPKSRAISCGFASATYPDQHKLDDAHGCGDGTTPGGKPIVGNNPTDTSQAIGPDFVGDWVQHLVTQFGTGEENGVAFYNLDNEPFLWH